MDNYRATTFNQITAFVGKFDLKWPWKSKLNLKKCLLVIGGKMGRPVFKREPIKVFKVDL